MSAVRARVAVGGRLVPPAAVRKEAGIAEGADVLIRVVHGEVRIETAARAIAKARSRAKELMARGSGNWSVDDFLRERRSLWG